MVTEPLRPGDVVLEVDHNDRLVECYLVLLVHTPERGGGPACVRRAGTSAKRAEDWPEGRRWRRAYHVHGWRMPPLVGP